MKDCTVCGKEYTPLNSMQRVCSPSCAIKTVKASKKAQREHVKARKEKLKTRATWIYDAQREFNTYIRLRDAGKPCICCGRFSNGWTRGGDWDAGHFRSRGAAPHLRFDERNCHAQLKQCNRRAFDVASYRRNLVGRIGPAEVESLEADNEPRKWTVEKLRAIRDEYRLKARLLKQQHEREAALDAMAENAAELGLEY